MVLTPRGKCISEWLPNEVIFQIIEAVQPHRGPASSLQDLAVPILYCVVHLDKWTSIVGFCDTVLDNAAKFAELVRSLTVTVGYTGQ
jgi:hypothetical protein